jgi:hypothetical protein
LIWITEAGLAGYRAYLKRYVASKWQAPMMSAGSPPEAGYPFDDPVKVLPRYFRRTVILTAILVPISIVMFINTSFSNDVGNLLKANDAAAITLHEGLVNYQSALQSTAPNPGDRDNQNKSTPNLQALLAPNLVQELAQFARVSRQIFYDSQVLNQFIQKQYRD